MPAELGDVPVPFVVTVAGLIGAVLGSFLNVCIVRWGAEPKQSVVRPPSRCPKCGAGIRWYDNVPVLGWLWLGGRCRDCRNPIPPMYPLIELAVAALWAYEAWRLGPSLEALRGAVFGTVLLGIAVTDARAYLIPDEFSLGGLGLGLTFSVLHGWGWDGAGGALVGAAAGFGTLWLVGAVGAAVLKQEAMGGGDVKMMAMVGTFLGWKGVFLTIFLGALAGTIVFLPLTLLGRKQLVPFGIFLAAGAAITWEAGDALVRWYAGYLGLQ